MDKKIELRKVRDFGEIINDTFAFIGQNWKPLLKAYAVICGFFVLASLLVSILNQIKIMEYTNAGANMPFAYRKSPFGMFGWQYFLAIVFAIVSYTSINITTLAYVAVYREKGNMPATVEEVWGYFKFYFLRATGSAILLSIGLIVGFVLCLIPGIYLLPAFSLVLPVMILENTTLGFAFSRGFQLVKDNYWTTLGVIVISFIIVFVASMVFALPLSIFNVSSVLFGAHKLNTTSIILTSIAGHICQVFYIMPEIAIAFCYFSLTEQKDNTGLLDRINNLGNPDQLDQLDDQLPTEQY